MSDGPAGTAMNGNPVCDSQTLIFISELSRAELPTADEMIAHAEFMRLSRDPQLLHAYINQKRDGGGHCTGRLTWQDTTARSMADCAISLSSAATPPLWKPSARFDWSGGSDAWFCRAHDPLPIAFEATTDDKELAVEFNGQANRWHNSTADDSAKSGRSLKLFWIIDIVLRVMGFR